jgi:hypothetical protein
VFTIVKIIVSAILIAAVTSISKKYPTFGGIIAALPLVSLLSLIWLYFQGEQGPNLNKFIIGVLYGFPATVCLLLVVAFCLKYSLSLFLSIAFGIAGWSIFLALQHLLLKQF